MPAPRRPITRRAVLAGGVSLGLGAVLGPLRPPAVGTSIPIGVPLLPGTLANARLAVRFAFGANLATDPYGLAWTWTDVSRDVLQANQGRVSISPMGRSGQSQVSAPAAASWRMKNPRGDYTRHNPGSQYWPNLVPNIPVQVIVSLDGGATWSVRFQGEVTSLNPVHDVTGNYSVVVVQAYGVLRRLGMGTSPLGSALRRSVSRASTQPIAYWPCEDGARATSAASGLVGGSPMTTSGTVTFAADAGPAGSDVLPSLSGGSLTGVVPTGSFTNAYRLEFAVKYASPFAASSNTNVILRISMNTTQVSRIDIQANNATTDQGLIFDYIDGGAEVATGTGLAIDDGDWHWVSLDLHQSGANIAYVLYVDGVSVLSSTFATRTLARITSVVLNPNADSGTVSPPTAGQVVIWPSASSTVYTASTGHDGENAVTRMTRLCAEQGVALAVTGTTTTTMGPQKIDTFVNLMRASEATEAGFLSDGRGPGLRYVTRSARYNLAAALTLDASLGKCNDPAPMDDDLLRRNDVQVSMLNGSSALFVDTTSTTGTGSGEYDGSVSVNYSDDSQLGFRAAWEVSRGTVDDFRYTALGINLLRDPDLAVAWLAAGDNTRVDVTNAQAVRPQLPPGDISQIIEGYSEEISTFLWDVALNSAPYSPWRVAVLESSVAEYGWRLDSSGSTLHQGCPTGATSILVDINDGYPWSGTPSDWPRDLDIGGVQVTATVAPSGVTQQTFTVAATAYPLVGGSAVKLWRPPKLAL